MITEHERPSTEGKGGGKQKLRKTDVDVPLCTRRSDDQNNLAEKEKGNSKEAAVKEDYERSNKGGKKKIINRNGRGTRIHIRRATNEHEVIEIK